jgi:DNA-binding transcriptional LysR family regulator
MNPVVSKAYLSPMKLVAFVARNDPIARKKELTLAELEDIPLVVRSNSGSESTTQSLLMALKRPGHKINIAMACEAPEAIMRAVGQTLGIGFLYYDAVRDAIERGSFKIIHIHDLKIEGETYIVYHNQRPLSPNAQEFLKLLRDWRDEQNVKKPKLLATAHATA